MGAGPRDRRGPVAGSSTDGSNTIKYPTVPIGTAPGDTTGALLSIPTELAHFLNRPVPQSVLVRGLPGTGKTTLVCALLDAYRGRRIYVSGRVSRGDLERDFSSLSNSVRSGKVSIVEMGLGRTGLGQTLSALKGLDQLVEGGLASVDLRALLLPQEVLDAWSQASASTPTLIVIDSWDAIVERYMDGARGPNGPAFSREEIERVALAQMAQGPVFFVLVSERPDSGQLDYLVNGVVSLERETREGRLERWLKIDKLRGTRVTHSRYPFSLEGGRFQCIAPVSTDPPRALRIDPAPGRSAGQIWPGSVDYASFFGWLPLHHLSLIEHDPEVPMAVLNRLTMPFACEVLGRQGRIFHVLPPGMHPSDAWNLYQDHVSMEAFRQQVRLLSPPTPQGTEEEFAPVMLPLPSTAEGGYSPRTPEAAKFLRENPDPASPNLGLIWVDGLNALNSLQPGTYTPETLAGMTLTYLRESAVHTVWIGSEADPLMRSLRPVAATRIRLRAREGPVFVHGITPRTPSLVLSDADDRGPYRLLLVV